MIQIHDSKKKGEYFVRSTAKNGEPLATSETLKSKQAVGKHLIAMWMLWVGLSSRPLSDVIIELDPDLIDHTKEGYWAKRYDCKKYVPKKMKK